MNLDLHLWLLLLLHRVWVSLLLLFLLLLWGRFKSLRCRRLLWMSLWLRQCCWLPGLLLLVLVLVLLLLLQLLGLLLQQLGGHLNRQCSTKCSCSPL